jgi:hypothetical protein
MAVEALDEWMSAVINTPEDAQISTARKPIPVNADRVEKLMNLFMLAISWVR